MKLDFWLTIFCCTPLRRHSANGKQTFVYWQTTSFMLNEIPKVLNSSNDSMFLFSTAMWIYIYKKTQKTYTLKCSTQYMHAWVYERLLHSTKSYWVQYVWVFTPAAALNPAQLKRCFFFYTKPLNSILLHYFIVKRVFFGHGNFFLK